ncbi:MAG: type transport system permease protein [Gaiellaceae bacterium]|jgi:ABC-type transport system involved in multi-copper enzyme maturation permease subunit|nr:type transport system permease protein [Gaiellaceae bacterium]
MSTVALPAPRTRTHTGRVTQLRVALSEWTKLRTLRSTRYTLFAGVALTIVFAVIPALVNATRWNRMSVIDKAGFHALETSLIGVSFAQLAFGVLGVLIISGEYSTGMIRSSFAAVPKRLPVLWAKAGIYGLVTLLLAVPSTLIAFFAAQAILKGHTFNGHDIALSFSDPGVARAVLGGALYLTLSGLFGLGLGAILRNTAAGISAFAAILFVLPPLMNVLPSSWNNAISPYLPSNAGSAIMQSGTPDHILAPWTGLGLFALYTAAAIAIAAIQLRRKDV